MMNINYLLKKSVFILILLSCTPIICQEYPDKRTEESVVVDALIDNEMPEDNFRIINNSKLMNFEINIYAFDNSLKSWEFAGKCNVKKNNETYGIDGDEYLKESLNKYRYYSIEAPHIQELLKSSYIKNDDLYILLEDDGNIIDDNQITYETSSTPRSSDNTKASKKNPLIPKRIENSIIVDSLIDNKLPRDHFRIINNTNTINFDLSIYAYDDKKAEWIYAGSCFITDSEKKFGIDNDDQLKKELNNFRYYSIEAEDITKYKYSAKISSNDLYITLQEDGFETKVERTKKTLDKYSRVYVCLDPSKVTLNTPGYFIVSNFYFSFFPGWSESVSLASIKNINMINDMLTKKGYEITRDINDAELVLIAGFETGFTSTVDVNLIDVKTEELILHTQGDSTLCWTASANVSDALEEAIEDIPACSKTKEERKLTRINENKVDAIIGYEKDSFLLKYETNAQGIVEYKLLKTLDDVDNFIAQLIGTGYVNVSNTFDNKNMSPLIRETLEMSNSNGCYGYIENIAKDSIVEINYFKYGVYNTMRLQKKIKC